MGKQALHLVSCSTVLDNLSFQPVWKPGNPYAWNFIIDISAAGRVIRPTTASWTEGRGNGWLHSLDLLFRYSALNGLILIYLSSPWTRTTNCTQNFASCVMLTDLSATQSSFSPLEKVHVLGSFPQERRRVFMLICSFYYCQSLCGTEEPWASEKLAFWLASYLSFKWSSQCLASAGSSTVTNAQWWLTGRCLLVLWNVWSENTHRGFVHFSKPGRTFLWPK